jgi:lysophospholipase L1-like esterase
MTFFKFGTIRLRRIGLVFLNIIAVMGTLEFCCRNLIETPFELIVRGEYCRHLTPNIDRKVWNKETQKFIQLKTNSLGFRDHEPEIPKPSGVKRIAVLGDSFVAAEQVPHEQVFTEQLETRLNQNGDGTRWEVLNFGVPGTGTADQHVRYLHHVRQCHPDIVILCFGMSTDLVDLNPRLSTNPLANYDFNEQGQLELVPQSASTQQANNLLNDHSRFYIWQKQRLNRLRKTWKSKTGQINVRHKIYFDPPLAKFDHSWKLLKAILRIFRDDVESDGAQFVVMTMPNANTIYPDVFAEFVAEIRQENPAQQISRDLPLERLEEIVDSAQIQFLSLERSFRAGLKSGTISNNQDLFPGRSGHLSAFGHQETAKSLQEYLSRQLRLYDVTEPPKQLATEPDRTVF